MGWPFVGPDLDGLRRRQRELLLALPEGYVVRAAASLASERGNPRPGEELALRRFIARLADETHAELVDGLLRRARKLLLLGILGDLSPAQRSVLAEQRHPELTDEVASDDDIISHEEPIRMLAALLVLAERAGDDGWTYDLLAH